MRDWEAIRADYATGAYSFQDLGTKYGISRIAIYKRAKKEEWQRLDKDESQKLVKASKEIARLTEVNKLTITSLTKAIIDIASLENDRNEVAQKLYARNIEMLDTIETPKDLADCAKAFKDTTTPFMKLDTTVAIQNNTLPQIVIHGADS